MKKERKIYIATSWKNSNYVKIIAKKLGDEGFKVFAFCESENRESGLDNFVFDYREFNVIPKSDLNFIDFMNYEQSNRAFNSDKAGLDWCDTVVLLLPCGKSSHLEAGYAVGKGKQLFIIGDRVQNEFDVMYGFATALAETYDQLLFELNQ